MPKILIDLVVKSMHSALQSAIDTPFREPILAMTYFYLLGFKPEKLSKMLITDFLPLKKQNLYGLHKMCIGTYGWRYLDPCFLELLKKLFENVKTE